MPTASVNGVDLHWESTSQHGPRLVLIHGAWVDRHDWDEFLPHVEDRFQVLTYDRRGHGDSSRPDFQGRMQNDVDELAALLNQLAFAPANLVGNSYGAMVALKLAAQRPDLCSSVTAHEPPFLHLNPSVMADPAVAAIDRLQRETIRLLSEGEVDLAIRRFMDQVLAPNVWDDFPEDFRAYLRSSAPSFVDDVNDPDPWSVDMDSLGRFEGPIMLTQGELSPAWYRAIIDEICAAVPSAVRKTIEGAGHGPHFDQPERYAEIVSELIVGTHG